MKIALSEYSKVWKANDKPIIVRCPETWTISLLGKKENDMDAPGVSVDIEFPGGNDFVWDFERRQNFLEMLKAACDELLEANAKYRKMLQDENERQEAYEKAVEELEANQQKEMEQLEAVKELKDKHQKEFAAVKEQLRQKYGIDNEHH